MVVRDGTTNRSKIITTLLCRTRWVMEQKNRRNGERNVSIFLKIQILF